MSFFGTYAGVIEAVDDPEKVGRVKARVVQVYGPTSGGVGTEDLPWALPAGLPAGGSAATGGFNWTPAVGDAVFVRFLDGEPEKPVWEWGTQTRRQRDRFGFRRYEGARPKSEVLLTRFGHSLELSPSSLIMTTRTGYALLIQDSSTPASLDGLWELRTAKGSLVRLEDLIDTLFVSVKNIVETYHYRLAMGDISTYRMKKIFTADGGGLSQLVARKVELGGVGASDPVVRQSDLQAAIDAIKATYDGHNHIGKHGPTSPAIQKLSVTARGSSVSFST